MISKLVSSLFRLVFLTIIFIFLFYPDKFHITFQYPGYPQSDSFYVRLAKTAFWFLLIVETLRMFYYGVVKSNAKGWIAHVVTVIVPLAVTLIFLEIVFMYIPQSHEGVSSKASQIWWEKYWQPVNLLGYRDREAAPEPGKMNMLFVGDSFTAGHGLKTVDERFSDVVGAALGDKYNVHNLGVSGADTRDEAQRLQDFPLKPQVIVLQYFPNDIEKVGREMGLSLSGASPYADLNGSAIGLVKRFYLPNFIYWQLPHASFGTFEKFVHTAYTDTTVLNAHLRDMSKMIAYRDSTGAKMYAVFIPFLFQAEKSAGYTKPVENYLKERGVTVITLNSEIAEIPKKELIVGKNDGHASAKLNGIIAEKLLKSMASADQLK